MGSVQFAQGMVRPGAWAVGGVVHRQNFIDPPDAHRYIPAMWSRSAIEAAGFRYVMQAQVKSVVPSWSVTTSTYMPVSTQVASFVPFVISSHCLICGETGCFKVHNLPHRDAGYVGKW